MNIFITGANSGFGREMTIVLANAGHRVFAGIRALEGRNASAASELIQSNSSTSGKIEPVEIDVASDVSVDAAISDVLARTDGVLDVVINNAGQYLGGLNETLSVAQVENMTNVNFLGPLRILRAVLPHLRAQGRGTLITVTSDVSRLVLPGSGLYAATKSALETAVESYAMELTPLGIESLIVQPGAFGTGIMQKAPASNGAERMSGYGPTLGHLQKMGEGFKSKAGRNFTEGSPVQVADAIVALLNSPYGQRPLRTIVDLSEVGTHASDLNDAISAVQDRFLTNLGVDFFKPLREIAQ